jgi:hypothetical protein
MFALVTGVLPVLTVAHAPASSGEPPMSASAKGSFTVSLKPLSLSEVASSTDLGRMSIDKVFSGDLQGSSRGEMLSVMGGVEGSASYVAMERVTATLHGRRGSFALQHNGTMDRGARSLSISVVPDSGTDGFTGITGRMQIDITGGQHFYTFEYVLPPAE